MCLVILPLACIWVYVFHRYLQMGCDLISLGRGACDKYKHFRFIRGGGCLRTYLCKGITLTVTKFELMYDSWTHAVRHDIIRSTKVVLNCWMTQTRVSHLVFSNGVVDFPAPQKQTPRQWCSCSGPVYDTNPLTEALMILHLVTYWYEASNK